MIRINLLRTEKKEIGEAPEGPPVESPQEKKSPHYGLIFLLDFVIILALIILQRNQIFQERNLLEQAQAQKKRLEYVNAKLNTLEQQKELLQRKISLITRLKSQQGNAVILMDELSKNLPDWVWLTEASFSGNGIRLKGKAISNNLLADYIFNMKQSPYFDNISLISSTLKTVQNTQYLEFSLTANFISPQASTEESNNAEQGERP